MVMCWDTDNLLILHFQLVLSVTPGPTHFTMCKKSSFKFIVACICCLMQMEILKGCEESVAVHRKCIQHVVLFSFIMQFLQNQVSNYYRNFPAGDQLLLKIW